MCGICGVLELNEDRPVSESLVRRMARVARHRGPDDEGYYFGPRIGLGHTRLSIIDLSGGHQPLENEDGTVRIVFNGEIYNYSQLADLLRRAGHSFRSRSDTETIVHAYEEYGTACVEKLRGMFAFAIWDQSRMRLLLARDRLGIKPLYYTVRDGRLLFASEIKSILQDACIPRKIDEDALEYFLSLRYVPDPLTMFSGIYKLPPGNILVCEQGQITIRQYWDLVYRDCEDGDLGKWLDRFEEKVRETVGCHLMSEVPLGAFLSGGIDSSLVVAFMSLLGSNNPVKTFSVGYKGKPHVSEFPYARLVADRYRCDHRELEIEPGEFSDFIPRMVWYLDEPVADAACLPLYFLSQLTKRHVTVILSGEGADETLAGYYLYKKMLLIDRIRTLPAAGISLSLLGNLMPQGKLRRYLLSAGLPLERRYRGVSTAFTDEQLKKLCPWRSNPGELVEAFAKSIFDRTKGAHPLNRMLYFDARVYLPGDLLIKADKMTMAWSLELRVPFLDHELVELTACMPVNAKIEGKTTKRISRLVAARLLPREIIERPKRGFPVPIEEWFAEQLDPFSRSVLLSERSSISDLVNRKEVGKLLDRHRSGKEDCSDRIWTLLVLEHWKRIFIDASSVAENEENLLELRPK